jgi:hypothetical protein
MSVHILYIGYFCGCGLQVEESELQNTFLEFDVEVVKRRDVICEARRQSPARPTSCTLKLCLTLPVSQAIRLALPISVCAFADIPMLSPSVLFRLFNANAQTTVSNIRHSTNPIKQAPTNPPAPLQQLPRLPHNLSSDAVLISAEEAVKYVSNGLILQTRRKGGSTHPIDANNPHRLSRLLPRP